MAAKGSRAPTRRKGRWAHAVADVIGELEEFREALQQKRRELKRKTAAERKAELVAEMCRYWEEWRATRGGFMVAVFAWSRTKDIEFRGDDLGALRAFARLALDLDTRRASEFAKMMARVLDTTLPNQAAKQIAADGKPWLMVRRLYTRDRPVIGPAARRQTRPLSETPVIMNKGGEAFIERARRDVGSPCRAATHYDDLRRLLQKEASEGPLAGVEGKHLEKSLAAWAKIRCDDHVCNTAKCEYRKHEDWLEELDVETLYELLEARLS